MMVSNSNHYFLYFFDFYVPWNLTFYKRNDLKIFITHWNKKPLKLWDVFRTTTSQFFLIPNSRFLIGASGFLFSSTYALLLISNSDCSEIRQKLTCWCLYFLKIFLFHLCFIISPCNLIIKIYIRNGFRGGKCSICLQKSIDLHDLL